MEKIENPRASTLSRILSAIQGQGTGGLRATLGFVVLVGALIALSGVVG